MRKREVSSAKRMARRTKLVRRKKSKRFRVLREKGRPTSHAIGEVFLVGVQNVRGLGGINVMVFLLRKTKGHYRLIGRYWSKFRF